MKFNVEQLNIAYRLLRRCEEQISKDTGISVRLHLLDASIENKTHQEMLAKIAEALGMPIDAYKIASKKAEFVDLRFIAAVMLEDYYPSLTAKAVAEIFGGQDHTTVLNARVSARKYLATQDERFCKKYHIVKQAIEEWLMQGGAYA